MSLAFHSTKESLYLQVYDHYKNLIMEHRIPAGSRMPSLRKCAATSSPVPRAVTT